MRNDFEPVQPGNPHQLTIDQHAFPARSIGRYAVNGRVDVIEVRENRRLSRKPGDKLFISKRLWDDHSEHGFMNEVEVSFQKVADRILDGHRSLTDSENHAISDFYLLWNLRERARSEKTIYPQLPAYEGKKIVVDKDRQERHEKRGVLYWDQNGEMPNRFLTGASLQQQLFAERETMKRTFWGVFEVKPSQGEFLVSDRLCSHTVVPISPNICLVAHRKSRLVDFAFVARLNGLASEDSERYCFARNIENCPILVAATLKDELTRAKILRHSLVHD